MKNKGFTLVELIAVIVLMGLLVLVIFPATSRLIRENDTKKYQTYYELVGKGLEKYAKTRRDDIGGIDGYGCVDDINLTSLVEKKYVKEFDLDNDVVCKSPNELSDAELFDAGIDASLDYADMRIDNIHGKITISYSMICMKKNSNDIKFQTLVQNTSECKKNVPEISSSLFSILEKMREEGQFTVLEDGNTLYLDKNGSNATIDNNYLFYSGKLWRILSYDTNSKTVKLIMDNPVSIRKYENVNYNASGLKSWLNDKTVDGNFLSSLKSPEKYTESEIWNYSAVDDGTSLEKSSLSDPGSVGMLTYYEYSRAGSFIKNNQDYWLLSPRKNSLNNVWYVNTSGTVAEDNVNNYHGIRPVIVLKHSVTIASGGTGEKNNPFRIVGDASASVGTAISTRFPGEYVLLGSRIYRIVSTKNGYIKMIDVDVVQDIEEKMDTGKTYSDTDYIGFNQSTTLYNNMHSLLWPTLGDYLTNTNFCIMKKNASNNLEEDCTEEFSIALPRLGEMFTTGIEKKYWTLTNESISKIYSVGPTGNLIPLTKNDTASIRPVIVIEGNRSIIGGSGTYINPYMIG